METLVRPEGPSWVNVAALHAVRSGTYSTISRGHYCFTSACTSTNVRTLGVFGRCFCCWEDADGCLVRVSMRPLSVRPRARCSLRLLLGRPLLLGRSVRSDSGCFAGRSLLEVLTDLGCCGERNNAMYADPMFWV